jgi:antitoxin MazE
MDTVIRKWGNSLAVRLPMAIISEARFNLEQKVSITAKEGRIIIEPLQKLEYSLEELVAGISPQNAHGEASFGPPVAKETL